LLPSYRHLKILSVNLFKELIPAFRKYPILNFAPKPGCVPEKFFQKPPITCTKMPKNEHLGFTPPVLHPMSGEHWKN
jgi:hypothetical protein